MEALTLPDEVFITRYLAPYSGNTLTGYQRTMLDWLTFCIQARIHILEADRTHIEQWAKSLGQAGKAKGTISAKLVPVCGFYRWAAEEHLIPRDVAAFVRRPSRPRRSNLKWLEADQAERMLAASLEVGPPASGLVHLLLLNGLRLTETITARIEHLGRQGDATTLRLPYRKGGVMDIVSLPDRTVDALVGCIAGRDRGLILRSDGRKLASVGVYRMLDHLSDITRLEFHVRPHMLRATFVTLSLDAGVPVRDIIASAGWATPSMLNYYDRAHASIRRNASHRLSDYLATTQDGAPTQP